MKKYLWILAFCLLAAAIAIDSKPLLIASLILFVIAILTGIRGGKGLPGEGVAGEGVGYSGGEHHYDSGSESFGDSDGGGDGGGD